MVNRLAIVDSASTMYRAPAAGLNNRNTHISDGMMQESIIHNGNDDAEYEADTGITLHRFYRSYS